jgi:gluconolactonase
MRAIVKTLLAVGGSLAVGVGISSAQTNGNVPTRRPDVIVDLSSAEGAALVGARWRYHDAQIVEVDHRNPGPDLRATGTPNRTHDIAPHAGAAEFDDSGWEVIEPASLQARRSTGKLCFAWYRTTVTIPDRLRGLDLTGSAVVFEVVVDDYAEVWVDGRLPVVLGQSGGSLVGGFNSPSRILLTDDARPGQRITLAVFAANGPLSNPPANFIWIRSATLDFYKPGRLGVLETLPADVERRDPAIDAIVARDARLEKLAAGFLFTEGPVWSDDGYLLFSDPNANTVYRWSPDGQVSVFRAKSGYAGVDVGEYPQPGSNGLTFDPEGRLTIAEHGNRRVTRIEPSGVVTVLADRYEGRRLNSPNDLVYRSDGALFFTDPPFGLPHAFADARKELPVSGVFSLAHGRLRLVSDELSGPNGLAFSPDEQYLYVGDWDPARKVVMRYRVNPDTSLTEGKIFYDMTAAAGDDAIDGIKVDRRGNVYVSGPGGLWILSPDGRHLGTIRGPEHPHNLAWGDRDGRTLFLTAQTGLYRIRLEVEGIRPGHLPKSSSQGSDAPDAPRR